jgi:hypothetical protein
VPSAGTKGETIQCARSSQDLKIAAGLSEELEEQVLPAALDRQISFIPTRDERLERLFRKAHNRREMVGSVETGTRSSIGRSEERTSRAS